MKSFALGGRARVSRVLVAVFSALMSLGLASAQVQQTAGIAVLVSDPSGAVIPNASVQVMNDTDKAMGSGTTNQRGLFTLVGLTAGAYVIDVSAQGFKKDREEVKAAAGVITNLEVTLPLGGSGPQVITGDGAQVESAPDTQLDPIPYTPLPPERPNFFRSLFGGFFHKMGF